MLYCIHIKQGQTDLNLRYRWQTSFGHIASVHGHTILIGDDGWLSHHISISIPLYILYCVRVTLTLKDGRWMRRIRWSKDGKFEHYWPLDIIQIPPDFATCIIQKTPWLNLSIMHKHQNTSTSYLFQNLLYQNCPNVFLHDLPLFVFTLCLTTHNSMNLKIDQLSYKNQMILNEMNYKN